MHLPRSILRRTPRGGAILVHFGAPFEAPAMELSVHRTNTIIGSRVTVGAESENIGFGVSLWPLCVNVSLSDAFNLPYEWFDHCHGRNTGWRFALDTDAPSRRWMLHDGYLTIDVWHDRMSWSRDQLDHWPWEESGWNFTRHPLRFLFGDLDVEVHPDEEEGEVDITMPEGVYAGRYMLRRIRQNRRWWKGAWCWQAHIGVGDGIPVPGKGSMPYNIDDDAIHSLAVGFPGADKPAPEQLAQALHEACMETRERYRSESWVPDDGWPEHCRLHEDGP